MGGLTCTWVGTPEIVAPRLLQRRQGGGWTVRTWRRYGKLILALVAVGFMVLRMASEMGLLRGAGSTP